MEIKEEIIKGLNDQQKAAVINYAGPTLIVAGAGSGKTKTLTQRIAYMLSEGVNPEEIMALTFTKKAAGEMKSRIMDAVGRECRPWKITMGTFHSVFIKFLSEFANKIGFEEKFSIYDESDSTTLIKQIVKRRGLDDAKYKPSMLKSRISLAKNNLLTPQQYNQIPKLTDEDKQLRIPQFIDVFREYCIEVKRNGAMDFDDILLNMYALLRDNPDVRKILGERFRYILVDEYQDTNLAQYKILRCLTENHQNICVVGDDSQSIYSFRGAKVENILRFRNDYPAANTFLLEQNYRSTCNIVNAANSLINHNTKRLEKHLFSSLGEGDPIQVFSCYSDKNEVSTVVRDIKRKLLENGDENESDFAVLYRNNSLSRLMEDELRNNNIPYLVYGGHSFYNRKEILDMVAYMKFCLNDKDDISLLRILNTPSRGIGETSISKLRTVAAEKGLSMWETLNSTTPEELGIRGKAVAGLKGFKTLITELQNDKTISSASQFVVELIDRSNICNILKSSKNFEDEERAENIESLKVAVLEWEASMIENPEYEQIMQLPADGQLQQWLTDIALLSDTDTKNDGRPRVTLMTVHASKGLEFKNVYIIGVEEEIFPSVRADTLESLEEERRIFYVAITRAKKFVALSWSSERFRFGSYTNSRMSRFIREIDPQYVNGLQSLKRLPWDDEPAFTSSKFTSSNFASSNFTSSNQKPLTGSFIPSNSFKAKDKFSTDDSRAKFRASNTIATPEKSSNGDFKSTTKPSPNAIKTTYRKDDVKEIEESNGIRKGTRIEHRVFGKGTVRKLELRGSDVKISISFDVAGDKVLIERFGSLKIL